MRFDISLIRFVFFAALVSAGYYLKPIDGKAGFSAAVGGVIAVLIIFFEMRVRKVPLARNGFPVALFHAGRL